MKLRFKVTFKRGQRTVAEVLGQDEVDVTRLTVGEVVQQVTETEQFLEKLTGLRVHIEQVQ